MTEWLKLEDIEVKSSLMRGIANLADIDGGFMKDFVRKILIAKDEKWFSKNHDEWKVTAYHSWAPPNSYLPSYWEDRAMALCVYDITNNNFGMSFLDLMDLDVATFEKIEDRVHKIVEQQQAAVPEELKTQLKKHKNGAT